jgi:23S rRNA (uracil1939-C5)-methyltransferase
MSMESQVFEIEIGTLVYGGDAIGRLPDGRAVFVPFALPGERVRIQIVEEKARHAHAELLEVLDASDQRIKPRCLHFGLCGGCQYQHMSYKDQLIVKMQIVREQMQRLAGITDLPLRPIVPSPSPWNYRNNMQLHQTPEGKLGYFTNSQPRVFAISECHLPEMELNDVWPRLDLEAIPGVDRIELRLDARDEVLMVMESTDPMELPEMELEMPLSVVHLSEAGSIVMAGEDHAIMQVLDRPFYLSAGSFFQVNTPQAGAMVQYLLDKLPLATHPVILDVYCGVGLFSAFLAPKARQLIGVEYSPAACQDFALNLDEFDHVEIYQGTAEDVLPGLKIQPDIIVVDPPRAGIQPRALDTIVKMQAATIAYVSCDQATLARDAKRLLANGYTMLEITPFDLFPQTAHIESVSIFKRTGEPASTETRDRASRPANKRRRWK